jgi:hypothetical protein
MGHVFCKDGSPETCSGCLSQTYKKESGMDKDNEKMPGARAVFGPVANVTPGVSILTRMLFSV